MTQLVGEQTRYHLIPIHAPPDLGDAGVTCIDHDVRIVGTGSVGVIGIPVDIDTNTAVIAVSFGLCRCYIFIMACQNTGGEELLVSNLTAVLIQKLLHALMTYSCHMWASFLRRPCGVWERRWVLRSQSSAFPGPLRQR